MRRPALALVALAGAAATLLVRDRARRLLGVVLLAVAAGLVVVGLTPTRLGRGRRRAAGRVPVPSLVVLRARRWPQPRARYEAPTRSGASTPRDTWDALDRGEDPTA